MKRFHVHLHVEDLGKSIGFYSKLFAAEPMLEGREFLASRDDWFRPVFLLTGPDGGLYVTDMYQKIIEHIEYLPEEIRKYADVEAGRDRGRIWRIVAREKEAGSTPPRPIVIAGMPRAIGTFASVEEPASSGSAPTSRVAS